MQAILILSSITLIVASGFVGAEVGGAVAQWRTRRRRAKRGLATNFSD